jgi:ribosomal protein S18 acetylase RimI-like enzyme
MMTRASTPDRADAVFVTHATWALDRTPGMLTRVRPDLVLADSGLACDTFNFICRARLDETAARAAAREAVSHFAGVKRPFSWWVGPADRPTSLGEILRQIGLEDAESELAMALSLDALSDGVPSVAGLEVRRVGSRAELDTFARLSAANWDPPDRQVLAFYQQTAPALLSKDSPQWLYVGYLEGEPVATAEAAVEAGTVGLFNIATRPAFRGRGIGSTMTWRPLRDARAAGCDLAVLQAAPAGVGLYGRLGFASFGEITEYK